MQHKDVQFSPYSPRQLFTLVADVARYPEFLPWCRAARILRRESDTVFYAELVIAYKSFSERYTSRVELALGEGGAKPHAIHVVMTEGPFHHLTNEWVFTETEDHGTRIDFTLDFQFRNALLSSLLGPFFGAAAGRMAEAFKKRADELYKVA